MSVSLSPAAIAEVNRIKSKHPADALFRLGVQAGGCGGWYYTLSLEENANSSDRLFNCDGIQIVIDADSWPYLNGLTLDYTEDLMGGGFRFTNPNAFSSCGCGNSFSMSGPAAVAG
ncbi:MAG TPA: iron-sulfur cluster assembly accessory protein [Coleofasciculaceae cyanobacterium]